MFKGCGRDILLLVRGGDTAAAAMLSGCRWSGEGAVRDVLKGVERGRKGRSCEVMKWGGVGRGA